MDKRINDMTIGDPKKLIFSFMMPVVGANFLQQLYTIVDAAIVGRGVGVDALAAVGSTDWIYWFMLWAAAGFGQGFSVVIAAVFGEKDLVKLRKSINMSLIISIVMGVVLASVAVFLAKPVLRFLNTPEAIFDQAYIYVSIMYGGVLVITIYNNIAGILRALGDSRNPFIAMLISTIMNIILDLLFVLGFHWGVAGAAIASVISQTIAGTYCFIMFRRITTIRSTSEDWEIDRSIIWNLWKKGFATAFQYAVIAVGGIVLQFGVNSMGFLYVAGFTATNKLYGILESVSLAMGSAMMVYTSQNYGARSKQRIKEGVRISIIFGIIISIFLGGIMIIFGKNILLLFIDKSSEVAGQVLQIAYRYLFVMSTLLILLYIINTYRYIVMALDRMAIVLLSSGMEFAGRLGMTILTVTVLGTTGLYFVEITAWLCSAIILLSAYYIIIRKLNF